MSNETTPWIQRLFQHYVIGSLVQDSGGRGAAGSNVEEPGEIPAVPTLPTDRAHQLELAPETGEDAMASCGNSLFFQRLPPDVRRLILIEAFGDRIMHVDLQYRPPRHGTGDVISGLRSALSGAFSYPGSAPAGQGQSRSWQWCGCVCHRDPDWRVRHRRIRDTSVSEPMRDRCIEADGHDGAQACDGWPGEKPLKCRVGAMGWLRTCRQAYLEGIEILYGTNRFHFSGNHLLQNLGQLLRPEHLALIKSAEMVWRLGQVARPPNAHVDLSMDKRFSGWYTFTSLLKVVPDALPKLRYLHVVLSGTWYPDQMAPNDIMRRSAVDVLQPVDDMVKKFFLENRNLEEINVGLPYRIWLIREKRDTEATQRAEKSCLFEDVSDRIWRSLGVVPEDPGGHGAVEIGYWTRMDAWDGHF